MPWCLLPIEALARTQPDRYKRCCPHCPETVGTEAHFIFHCPKVAAIRAFFPELPFHTLSFDEMFKHPVPFGKFLAQASSLAIPGRP